jgi:hypothetical protein
MAPAACRECKAEVSTAAKVCPKCGIDSPYRPPHMGLGKQALILLAVIVGLVALNRGFQAPDANKPQPSNNSGASTPPATSSGALPSTPAPLTSKAPEPKPVGTQWSYEHTGDAMGKDAVYEAAVSSTNTVNFSFPYSGEQHGHLTLRTHPRYGKDVIFNIAKGQILCPSYEGCTVLVRFDDQEATKYSAAGPEDHSSETIFIRNYAKFLEKLAKAKRVRIEPNIYQQGAPVFEFDVSGFDQAKYIPKK